MNKELTPLDAFYDLKDVYWDDDIVKEKYGITPETAKSKFDIIENKLKQLEIYEAVFSIEKAREQYNKLKAFEVIKEKKPNLRIIFDTYEIETYDEYLNFVEENDREIGEDRHDLGKLLTKEEFDILKDVLK